MHVGQSHDQLANLACMNIVWPRLNATHIIVNYCACTPDSFMRLMFPDLDLHQHQRDGSLMAGGNTENLKLAIMESEN